jgi:hypothetical protein
MSKVLIGIPIHRPIEFKVFESFIRKISKRFNIPYDLNLILEFIKLNEKIVLNLINNKYDDNSIKEFNEKAIFFLNHKNVYYEFCMVSNSLIYDAREYIAHEFVKSENDYLMFIDSDMTFHPNSVEMLLRHNLEFVTAKAFKRVKPYQPCFYTKFEYKDGVPELEAPAQYGEGLLPIEGAGLACALIKRSAFEKIQQPYFFPLPNVGEDLTFCLKLKEAGVKMYCDTTLQFGHLGHTEIFEKDFVEEYTKLVQAQKVES